LKGAAKSIGAAIGSTESAARNAAEAAEKAARTAAEAAQDALDNARKGDIVIVWKLDRLARSLRQLIDTTVTPGVLLAVLTAADLPFGEETPNARGRCLLARGEVRFPGEPVAAVLAESEAAAADGALVVISAIQFSGSLQSYDMIFIY
jgi:xanthine dehydrogenase molybdopterin-binding subunit B